MSTFAERARLRAEARAAAAAAATTAAAPQRRGVRFIGDATGDLNVAPSPTRKASPHHRDRAATRRALKATARVSPANSPPLKPGRGAPKFRAAAERTSKKRSTRRKSRKARKPRRKHTRRIKH
jgi:hypothetical protein